MSIHYSLCMYANDKFLAIQNEDLVRFDIANDVVSLHYSSFLPQVFNISDDSQGEHFVLSGNSDYFLDCLLRLDSCVTSADPYNNSDFHNSVRKFILTWIKLARSTSFPICLVWS